MERGRVHPCNAREQMREEVSSVAQERSFALDAAQLLEEREG